MNASVFLTIGLTILAADKPKPPPSPLVKVLTTPVLEKDESFKQMRQFISARIPAFKLPADVNHWKSEAETMRRRFLDEVVLKGHDAGILAARPAVEWLGAIETGKGYSIRKLRYEGWPGMWIPALLYEPDKLDGKVPVVLNPNGHERGDGKAARYKQLRCINQAKRGMLALNPEWIAMGELNRPGYDHYELAYLDLCGRSGVGVFYMLLKRGLDVLLDHPNADSERVAVTGLSGGGWQTIFFSAIDTRVRLAVPNAGYIGQAARLEHRGDLGDLEQVPTDQLAVADYTHLTALLAPRPALLIYNEKDNCCFPSYRARLSVYDPIAPLYDLYGKPDGFLYHENRDPGTHNYELDNRQQLYKFLSAHFFPNGGKPAKEIPSDDEVLTKKQLTLGVPEGNQTFHTLSEAAAGRLPEKPLPKSDNLSSLKTWAVARRAALRKNLRLEPAAATAVEVKAIPSDDYTASAMKLKVGADWHLPAVEVARKDRHPKRIAIVVADGGRSQAESLARDFLDDDHRVLTVDLLFTGQCVPAGGGFAAWQYAMLVANTGQRPLGQKVRQLIAALDYAAERYPDQPITVAGIGRVSSVTAVLAAALSEKKRPARLVTVALPASLRLLIEKRVKYQDAPSLFCFGLLKEADICEMLALALPTRMTLIKTEGDKSQIQESLAPFAQLTKQSGQPASSLLLQNYPQ